MTLAPEMAFVDPRRSHDAAGAARRYFSSGGPDLFQLCALSKILAHFRAFLACGGRLFRRGNPVPFVVFWTAVSKHILRQGIL